MHYPIPADLWHRLLAYISAHPTCEVTLHFHQGTARKMQLAETVKAHECVTDIPASQLDAARQDLARRL